MLDLDASLKTHLIDDPSALNNPLCTDNHQVYFLQDVPVKKKEIKTLKKLLLPTYDTGFSFKLKYLPHSCIQNHCYWNIEFPQGLCHLPPEYRKYDKKRMNWMSVRPLGVERGHFTDSIHSPSWVRLRFSHIDREAFLLSCSLFQHPQDDSGVRVSQDFLLERHLGTQGKVTESPKYCKYKGCIVRVPASKLKNHWPSHSCSQLRVFLEDNIRCQESNFRPVQKYEKLLFWVTTSTHLKKINMSCTPRWSIQGFCYIWW